MSENTQGDELQAPEGAVSFMLNKVVTAAQLYYTAMEQLGKELGHPARPAWDDLRGDQRMTLCSVMSQQMDNIEPPAQTHAKWLAQQKEHGWVFGDTFDVATKTHPLMIENYADLPVVDRLIDSLRLHIAQAFLEVDDGRTVEDATEQFFTQTQEEAEATTGGPEHAGGPPADDAGLPG